YNQALAHPLGANFRELVTIVDYRYKRFFTELKYIYAQYGVDTGNVSYGKNIFIPDYGGLYNGVNYQFPYAKHPAQGPKNNLHYLEFKAGYLINPRTNMRITLSYVNRTITGVEVTNNKTQYFSVGFSTNLQNFYYDF
ncbi:hypothetical protein ACLGLW_19885, partial [Bacillus amyloliquefaciens]|uniref:hypothetical protein n=1 Tax=Bacillus amyloliquefaciens TaxID=1390 RepID=UPI00397F1F4D